MIHNNTTLPFENNVELLNFKNADLSESQINRVKMLFNNYNGVLSSTADEIGKINFFKYDIKLPENIQPIRRRPYTVSLNDKSILKSEIDKLLKAKIIKRNLSPWSLPVLLVSKRDTEEKRLCINMQEVNKLLPVPQYYIPNIDYLLTNLGNQKPVIFSKLDCKNAYNQIELTERASEICSFSTHLGSFSYTRCPFGINQIPAVFMSIMQQILGHLDNVYNIYLDDILIASTSFEEHINLLEEVLICLRKAGMTLSPSKTFIGVKEIEYIGYVIDKSGVRNAPHNLGKVIKFERPPKVAELRKWLGLCSFQRRFIPNYSGLAKVLYEKISESKHSKLVWSDEMIKSYEEIKMLVANSPKLGIVQFHNPNPVILSTDASDHAIAFNIKQAQLDEKTNKLVDTYLFFGGKNLVGSSIKWAIYKKELYAVVTALQRLESYLKPKLFHIYVDNLVVYYYLTKVQPNPPAIIARWLLYLNDFNYKVFHKKTNDRNMYISDYISRCRNIEDDKAAGHIDLPIDSSLNAITTNPFAHLNMQKDFGLEKINLDQIKKSQDSDAFFYAMKQYLLHDHEPRESNLKRRVKSLVNEFLVTDNVLYHIANIKHKTVWQQLCIGKEYISTILTNVHDNPLMGFHYGIANTVWRVRKNYFWFNLHRDVINFVKSCDVCCRATISRAPKILLNEKRLSERPFSVLHIDCCSISTVSQKYVGFCAIVDEFSRYLICVPVRNKRAKTIADIIFNEVILKYGFFTDMTWVSDFGPEFRGDVTRELFKACGIKHRIITCYHPQSNSIVEKINSTVLTLLRKYAQDQNKSWVTILKYATFIYNSTRHQSTQQSPLKLLHGIDTIHPMHLKLPQPSENISKSQHDAHKLWKTKLLKLRSMARENALKAAATQKRNYDKHAKPHQYSIGDTVYTIRNCFLKGQDPKLMSKFTKKYKIHTFLGKTNVILRTLGGKICKRSIHINKIRRIVTRKPYLNFQAQNITHKYDKLITSTPPIRKPVKKERPPKPSTRQSVKDNVDIQRAVNDNRKLQIYFLEKLEIVIQNKSCQK